MIKIVIIISLCFCQINGTYRSIFLNKNNSKILKTYKSGPCGEYVGTNHVVFISPFGRDSAFQEVLQYNILNIENLYNLAKPDMKEVKLYNEDRMFKDRKYCLDWYYCRQFLTNDPKKRRYKLEGSFYINFFTQWSEVFEFELVNENASTSMVFTDFVSNAKLGYIRYVGQQRL